MKNLAKHKIAVKTREVLVQAIYQHLFEKTPSKAFSYTHLTLPTSDLV